jgi:hypothetical protein
MIRIDIPTKLLFKLVNDSPRSISEYIASEYRGDFVTKSPDNNHILIPEGKLYTLFLLKYGEYL